MRVKLCVALAVLVTVSHAAEKRNPNYHAATAEQLVMREDDGDIKFGVDAGSSFRAEHRTGKGFVQGVYSWLKPDATPAYIAYTSSPDSGYRAVPLPKLGINLPAFPKTMATSTGAQTEDDMVIFEEQKPAVYYSVESETPSGFEGNDVLTSTDPDPEENASPGEEEKEEVVVTDPQQPQVPVVLPQGPLVTHPINEAARRPGFIDEKTLLPSMSHHHYPSHYPYYQLPYSHYYPYPLAFQPQQYHYKPQYNVYSGQRPQQYLPTVYKTSTGAVQPDITYYGAAKNRNPLNNLRYFGAAKPWGFATATGPSETAATPDKPEIVGYSVQNKPLFKPYPTNKIPIRPLGDDEDGGFGEPAVDVQGRTAGADSQALDDEAFRPRYSANSLKQFLSQFTEERA